MRYSKLKSVPLILLAMLAVGAYAQDFNWYSQGDSRWKYKSLGNSSYNTIGRSGCALTCVSMLLNAEASNPEVTPDQLNTWMRQNGGFRGADIRWEMASCFDGLAQGLELVAQSNKKNDWDFLTNELAKGNKVIVKVPTSRGHWVLVTNQDGPFDEPSSYTVNDPGSRDFQQKTLASWNKFYAARSFSGNWIDSQHLNISGKLVVSPSDTEENFIYNLANINSPADVYCKLKNNLSTPIAGYVFLTLFDENDKFIKIVDFDYLKIDQENTADVLMSVDDYKELETHLYRFKLVWAKQYDYQSFPVNYVTLATKALWGNNAFASELPTSDNDVLQPHSEDGSSAVN